MGIRFCAGVAVAMGWAAGLSAAVPSVTPSEAARKVTAAGAYATVERLSGPEFAGRLTGTPGYEAAARWAAGELRKAGLKPVVEIPDLLQRFPITVSGVERATMDVLPAEATGEVRHLQFFKDFLPLLYSGSGDATVEVVFVGYGITAPAFQRDDYASVDVKGRIVMAVRGAPKDGRDWTAHNSHRARTANAQAHGAAGYIFAEQAVANPNGEQIADLPMVDVSEEVANSLLASRGLKLEELHTMLAVGGTTSFATGRTVHLDVKARPAKPGEGANVIAVLPGSDPAVREFVMVGAHLDHCGDWPALLPGADDNASGSATVLEVARAAAALAPRPRRSIVIVLFGGEEIGLLGSKYLAAALPASLGRCVGVLNVDMAGVGTGAYVAGGDTFPGLLAAITVGRDAEDASFTLRSGASVGEARADHGPFQQVGIPAVSLFGMGKHNGYHQPDDTIWWITPKTMEVLGRVVLRAAVSLADAPATRAQSSGGSGSPGRLAGAREGVR